MQPLVVVKFDVRKCAIQYAIAIFFRKNGWEKLPWICPALEPVLSCTRPADLDLKTKQQVLMGKADKYIEVVFQSSFASFF